MIKANIRTADELRDLWASPKLKDRLRKRNQKLELIPSYAKNTDALDQYLQDSEVDDPDEALMIDLRIDNAIPKKKKNLKRKREPKVFKEIVVQRGPLPVSVPKKRKTMSQHLSAD